MAASSLIFEQEKVLPCAGLDMAHPRNNQQVCLKVGKCSICTILNATDSMGHLCIVFITLYVVIYVFHFVVRFVFFMLLGQLINEEIISFLCTMLYDDFWMKTTYVILYVAWMRILDSHIPLVNQRVPKQSQMLTITCQQPIKVHPLFHKRDSS